MCKPSRHKTGFSLVELMIVVAVLSIVAVMMLPNSDTGVSEQLEAAGRVLAGDLDYAHGLAIAYNSSYKITFSMPANTWTLTYSGTDNTLTTLPQSPTRSRQDAADRQVTNLGTLPGLTLPVSIYSMYAAASPISAITAVEFNSLGATTQAAESVIWLKIGAGTATRYLDVHVNPVTGLTTVGTFQSTAPPRPASQASATSGS